MPTDYEIARDAYWEAQRTFRLAAERAILSAVPTEIVTVRLSLNDTPRLTVDALIDADGRDRTDDFEDEWAVADSVASDMEIGDWDEAAGFLARDGETFIIERGH